MRYQLRLLLDGSSQVRNSDVDFAQDASQNLLES
jgi:hypothetical protein